MVRRSCQVILGRRNEDASSRWARHELGPGVVTDEPTNDSFAGLGESLDRPRIPEHREMNFIQSAGPRRTEVVNGPRPTPRWDEVLVRVTASGVCASELHTWTTPPAYRVCLGHEGVGVVEAIGDRVELVQPGDLVTGLMWPAFSEFVVTRQDLLLKVPRDVAPEVALGEPLGCLVNAVRRTRIELADQVAIVGLGYMGLGMLQLSKLKTPRRLLAVDVRSGALDLAVEFGADEAIRPGEVPADYLDGRDQPDHGFDVVIEASGTQAGLDLASDLVRQHGVLSIVGFHQGGSRTVDMESWNVKAIDVVNAHVRRTRDHMDSMAIGLELIANGSLDFDRLITHRYRLGEVDRAFADLEAKPAGFIKGIVIP